MFRRRGEDARNAGRGLLFWTLVTLLVVTVAVGGATWWAYRSIMNDLDAFASSTPLELPPTTATAQDLESAREKAEQMEKRLEEGGPPATVVWEASEIEAAIENLAKEESSELPGPVRVGVQGEDLLVTLSWPLEGHLPDERFDGKWLAGTFRVGVALAHGELDIEIREGRSPDGRELSGRLRSLIAQAGEEIVARSLGDKLDRFESIEIREGKVHLKLAEREPAPSDASSDDASGDEDSERESSEEPDRAAGTAPSS